MNKYFKGTIFEIPACCIFLLACWMIFYNVGMLIEYFTFPHLGKWGFILTFPITWPYVYVPAFEKMWQFFDETFL